jgi:hypothetical protein
MTTAVSAGRPMEQSSDPEQRVVVTVSADGGSAVVDARGASLPTRAARLHDLTIKRELRDVRVIIERGEDADAIKAGCWADGRGFRRPPVRWKVTG